MLQSVQASGPVLLRAISYEVGTAVPVGQLIDDGVSIETVNELLEKGVQGYSMLQRPLADALRDCALQSIATAGLVCDDIDAVIVVTESFTELFGSDAEVATFREVRNRSFDLFYAVGIRKAAIFCATFGGCTNLLQAVLTAKAMVQQGRTRHVLVVAAERFADADSRLMKEAVSVAGDGVAACIVSAAERAQETCFALDYISIAPYKTLQPGDDMASLLLEMFRAMKNAAADCYESLHRQPHQYSLVVLGDYNRNTTLTYSKLLGFPPERAFLDNVGRLGHIPFDPLINLADLVRLQRVKADERVLLFMCGPISCGALSVTAC